MRWRHPMCAQTGEAPNEDEVVRLRSCSEEGGAFLRSIPHNPHFLLGNADFKGALAFRLGIPLDVLQRAGEVECDCHRAHDARQRAEDACLDLASQLTEPFFGAQPSHHKRRCRSSPSRPQRAGFLPHPSHTL